MPIEVFDANFFQSDIANGYSTTNTADIILENKKLQLAQTAYHNISPVCQISEVLWANHIALSDLIIETKDLLLPIVGYGLIKISNVQCAFRVSNDGDIVYLVCDQKHPYLANILGEPYDLNTVNIMRAHRKNLIQQKLTILKNDPNCHTNQVDTYLSFIQQATANYADQIIVY